MVRNVVKVVVVVVLCAALGGLGYLLYQQTNSAAVPEGEMMPTGTVAKGTVVKQVKGTGEVKAAQVEKLKMPKWRYFRRLRGAAEQGDSGGHRAGELHVRGIRWWLRTTWLFCPRAFRRPRKK